MMFATTSLCEGAQWELRREVEIDDGSMTGSNGRKLYRKNRDGCLPASATSAARDSGGAVAVVAHIGVGKA